MLHTHMFPIRDTLCWTVDRERDCLFSITRAKVRKSRQVLGILENFWEVRNDHNIGGPEWFAQGTGFLIWEYPADLVGYTSTNLSTS